METRVSMLVDNGLTAGDQLTLTSGREIFPLEGGAFEVGPFAVTVTVCEDEKPQEAYLRARALTEAMYEAEFELKRQNYLERMSELSKA